MRGGPHESIRVFSQRPRAVRSDSLAVHVSSNFLPHLDPIRPPRSDQGGSGGTFSPRFRWGREPAAGAPRGAPRGPRRQYLRIGPPRRFPHYPERSRFQDLKASVRWPLQSCAHVRRIQRQVPSFSHSSSTPASLKSFPVLTCRLLRAADHCQSPATLGVRAARL